MDTPKSWEELKEKWGGLAKIFGYDLDKPEDVKRLLDDSSIIDTVNNELASIMMKLMERKQFRTWLEECIERCLRRIHTTTLDYSSDNETLIDLCSDMDKISDKIPECLGAVVWCMLWCRSRGIGRCKSSDCACVIGRIYQYRGY